MKNIERYQRVSLPQPHLKELEKLKQVKAKVSRKKKIMGSE
jgi:hypothetical protein